MSKCKNNEKYTKLLEAQNTLFVKLPLNTLSLDSKIIVPETHTAILIKDGILLDSLSNGSHLVSTLFTKEKQLSPLVEVLFVVKQTNTPIRWGTKTKFVMQDVMTKIPVHIGMHGEFTLQVVNPRKLYLELANGEDAFYLTDLATRLGLRFLSQIEESLVQTLQIEQISFLRIEEYKNKLAKSILELLETLFEWEYGIKITSFVIGGFAADANDLLAIERMQIEGEKQSCTVCGTNLQRGARYCSSCGSAIIKVCMHCGNEESAAAKFCSTCGKVLH